jgi:hypothetical protein
MFVLGILFFLFVFSSNPIEANMVSLRHGVRDFYMVANRARLSMRTIRSGHSGPDRG